MVHQLRRQPEEPTALSTQIRGKRTEVASDRLDAATTTADLIAAMPTKVIPFPDPRTIRSVDRSAARGRAIVDPRRSVASTSNP